MKQIKNRITLLIYVFFCILFYLAIWAGNSLTCEASEDTQFEIEVEFGYENYVKREHFVPVTINCQNTEKYFSGEIKVMAADSFYGEPITYTQAIEIKAGGQTGVRFYMPLSFYETKISVFLESDNGEEVYSKSFIPNVKLSEDIFVGVLGEDLEALSYLSAFKFNISDIYLEDISMRLFSFDTKIISENVKSLDLFDVIVMNDSDLSILNNKQQEMLDYWVGRGGILLTSTVISSYGEKSDYEVRDYFKGKLISFQFDLKDASFGEQENASKVHDIIAAEFSESDWKRIAGISYSFGYSGLQNALSNIMPEKMPNIGLYIVILFSYTVAFLIIYFTLKKKDKQRYIWVFLPATAFFYMIFIFTVGGKTRHDTPFLNYISVVEFDESKALENTFISTTSPKNDTYGFSILNNYEINILNDYNPYTYFINYFNTEILDKNHYKMNISENSEKTLINVNNQKAFGSITLGAVQLLDNVGDIDIELAYDGNGYRGTIANNTGYDLRDAGIIMPYTALILDDIESGETLDVYIEDDMYNSGLVYNYNTGEYLIPKTEDSSSEYETAIQTSKRNILSEFSSSNIYYNNYETYFVAFTDEFIPQLVEDINFNAAGNTLIAKVVDISFENNGIINYPDTSAFVTVLSGDTSKEELCMYSKEVELRYNFDKELWIDSLKVNINLLEKMNISVYFYNYSKGAYEQGFMDGDSTIDELSPYLSQDNQLTVRFTHNSFGASVEYAKVPSLAISGREK